MDLLADLGRLLGFSFAAGLNLYATVALLGLASRFGWMSLPPQYQAFDNDLILYTAIALYVIEFLADKIPWVDTVWDSVHTFIRPIGGAAIAVIGLGPSDPTLSAVAALVGGLVAGSSHVTKAGTRVIANASPEPFSNWALSLGEDALVVSLGVVALKYPVAALAVTTVLLGTIVFFAAAIVRAFKRRFRNRTPSPSRRSGMAVAAALAAALAAVGLAAQAPPPQAPPPPAGGQAAGQQPQEAQQPPRPVFRGGANFVRVDVYATKDGEAVSDLAAQDLEIFEDGVPQKVETFERVQIQTGGVAAARVEPRTVRESREAAADPRSRVFVIFLDTWHMKRGSGYNIRRPLLNLLERVIGQEDLVAIMRPQMAASDITFTRRTDHLAAMLQSVMPLTIGQRDSRMTEDPVEDQYRYCYPSLEPGRMTSVTAQAMIDRRREKQTLDALEDLVSHLDGLREERKAILIVSEGWLLYRENRALAEIAQPRLPGIGVGPTGQIGTSDRNNPYGSRQNDCDRDRLMLANLDHWNRFRELLDVANRTNTTFYPVDPRGLVVFDSDIGPDPPPTLQADAAMLRARLDSLTMAAENTDGVAVINTNDLDGGLRRVVTDMTSYYLVGYSSTNTKNDGRFREIRVRTRRPGVEIRARRGYRALTEREVAVRAAAEAPPVIDEAAAAVSRAVSSLESVRPNAMFRLQVSPGWWTPPGPPVAGQSGGAEPALWIAGEVDTKRQGGDDWSKGGEAEIAILSPKGDPITSYTVALAPGSSAFVSRFPRSADDVWLDPGAYAVRVRVKAASGGLASTDTMRFEVPAAPDPKAFVMGLPMYLRRGQSTGNAEIQTADVRFRRTERLIVQVSVSLPPDSVTAELLDRSGRVLPLPLNASAVTAEGVVWARGDTALASLAVGDYLVRLSAVRGADRRQVLAPFKIVP